MERFSAVPASVFIDLLISPILSYGNEIWGDNDWVEIERIHLFICKLSVGVKRSTPNDGIFAEIGRYPLLICRKIKEYKICAKTMANGR